MEGILVADVFKEQLIKKNPTSKDMITKVGIIAVVIMIFVVTMGIIPQLGVIITAAAGFGAFVLIGRLKREYEYIFTNGELDIDVIFNKSSRKRVFTGNVKDFELMTYVNNPDHQNSLSSASEKKDYSSGNTSDNSYVFLTTYQSKRTAVIIEPNDEMLEAISKSLTRRKFYPNKNNTSRVL